MSDSALQPPSQQLTPPHSLSSSAACVDASSHHASSRGDRSGASSRNANYNASRHAARAVRASHIRPALARSSRINTDDRRYPLTHHHAL